MKVSSWVLDDPCDAVFALRSVVDVSFDDSDTIALSGEFNAVSPRCFMVCVWLPSSFADLRDPLHFAFPDDDITAS